MFILVSLYNILISIERGGGRGRGRRILLPLASRADLRGREGGEGRTRREEREKKKKKRGEKIMLLYVDALGMTERREREGERKRGEGERERGRGKHTRAFYQSLADV